MSWIFTTNLANSAHTDNDASYSFSVWATVSDAPRSSWWFLFPDYGIALQLQDGAYCSWDGSMVSHCTAVPNEQDVQISDLHSVFTAVPRTVMTVARKRDLFKHNRQLIQNISNFLREGDHVLVKSYQFNTNDSSNENLRCLSCVFKTAPRVSV